MRNPTLPRLFCVTRKCVRFSWSRNTSHLCVGDSGKYRAPDISVSPESWSESQDSTLAHLPVHTTRTSLALYWTKGSWGFLGLGKAPVRTIFRASRLSSLPDSTGDHLAFIFSTILPYQAFLSGLVRGQAPGSGSHETRVQLNLQSGKQKIYIGLYDRRTRDIWPQSPIYGPCTATDVWVLRDCEVAEMEVRITHSLAGMGIGFDRDG